MYNELLTAGDPDVLVQVLLLDEVGGERASAVIEGLLPGQVAASRMDVAGNSTISSKEES